MSSSTTGYKLEDFVKIEKIGEGTYGVVFKGEDCSCDIARQRKIYLQYFLQERTRRPMRSWP